MRRGLRTIQVSVCKSFCVTSQYAISLFVCLGNDNSQITLVAKFHKKNPFLLAATIIMIFTPWGWLALDPLVVTSPLLCLLV